MDGPFGNTWSNESDTNVEDSDKRVIKTAQNLARAYHFVIEFGYKGFKIEVFKNAKQKQLLASKALYVVQFEMITKVVPIIHQNGKSKTNFA